MVVSDAKGLYNAKNDDFVVLASAWLGWYCLNHSHWSFISEFDWWDIIGGRLDFRA